ncbi:MAG TPA: serine hydrolase [Acidobacteriota bacterium]|jgi:beta-lactamase class A|nr:serine hydrolase [Acidobacteriota bacterium]
MDSQNSLQSMLRQIGQEAEVERLAAAFFDYEIGEQWGYQAEEWFHAASTIKVAVLLAVFGAVEERRFTLRSRLHVRNRFLSAADGRPYRVESARDSNSTVQAAIGKTMTVGELAHHMIATSSNLATNLLLDLVGVEYGRCMLERLHLEGIELRRGVEDERAFEANINNRITANGMIRLFRLIQEGHAFSSEASGRMLEILHRQEFKSGIPAGLPYPIRADARVAHKTGEISTVAHDAGLVFLPERKPYALAILTQSHPENNRARDAVSKISKVIYEHLTGSMSASEASGSGKDERGKRNE